ncbi:MAG TPA: ATP-binding protein [Solirubrobacteraceae bacterium]|nr:ATP-binding protein [Solirubrobacteraceae bacterium]
MLGLAAALTPPGAGVDVATGLVLAGAGAVALARGRGPLLLVAGVAWLAGDVWSELAYVHRGPLVHVLLGPSPVTAAAYVDGLVPALARSPWITLALCAAVVAGAPGPRRAAAAAVAGALALEAVGELVNADTSALAAWWYDLAVVAAAVAFAAVPRERRAEAVAADLVVDLGAEPGALRAALARAVGDPTLDVAYRIGDAWVDEAARPVQLPAAGGGRVVRAIDDLAVLVHDPAALRDAELARSVDSAVRLALANVRLQADVGARVREVELSRRRLVEASDAERRRLREQIGAGAERELAAAGEALAGRPELRAELELALADLVRFAQGIHPHTLAERGLRGALLELAGRSALDVSLAVTHDRFGGLQETAAYFVCSEGLANVAKYAAGADVRITVSSGGGSLEVRVDDDGPGGADPARGSGLRGLADRVEALGGRLDVKSQPGAGTHLIAELPA